MITAALQGLLDDVSYEVHPVFGLAYPTNCPGVPPEVLDARNTWDDRDAYDQKATSLAQQFINNFEKFAATANSETMAAAPRVMSAVAK